MNVIETFFYLFESDASKLDEGVDKTKRKTRELDKELTAADRTASLLGQSFKGVVAGLGAALAAGISVTAIVGMVRASNEATLALSDQSRALGVAIDRLDVWDAAVRTAGGSAGQFAQSVGTLGEKIQDVVLKGSQESAKLFDAFGVGLAELKANAADPIAILELMADRAAEMSAAEAGAIGKMLGLDQATLALLRQGREGVAEVIRQQRELGYVTEEQAEAARKYRAQLDRMNRVWDDVKRRLTTAVLPVLERLAAWMEGAGRLVREHSTAIAWGFGIMATAAAVLLAPALLKAATAARVLLIPLLKFAGVIAVLSAVALVAEDIYQFMRGNDSVTGEWAKKWPALGEAIRGVGHVLAWMIALAVEAGQFLVALFSDGPQAAIDGFRAGVRAIGNDIESIFPKLAGIAPMMEGVADAALAPFKVLVAGVETATQTIAALVHEGPAAALRELGGIVERLRQAFPTLSSAVGSAMQAMRRGVQSVVDLWEKLVGLVARAVQAAANPGAALLGLGRRLVGGGPDLLPSIAAGQAQLAVAGASPVGATSAAAITAGALTNNRSTTVDIGRVEVNTQATDAEGIASSFGSALRDQLRNATDYYDDGVEA